MSEDTSATTPRGHSDPHAPVDPPFERIGVDIVGPLIRSAGGRTHILVIIDYAT